MANIDLSYFQRRAAEEHAAARSSSCEAAAAVHRRLARGYDQRLRALDTADIAAGLDGKMIEPRVSG